MFAGVVGIDDEEARKAELPTMRPNSDIDGRWEKEKLSPRRNRIAKTQSQNKSHILGMHARRETRTLCPDQSRSPYATFGTQGKPYRIDFYVVLIEYHYSTN